MRLKIYKETATRVPVKRLQELFEVITGGEARIGWKADVNLVFTDNRRMRQLNEEFRHKNRSTDVLSFVIDEPVEAGEVFGEIYISVPIATEQAVEFGETLAEEYLRLFGHGLLHLFGYDHQDESEAEAMRAREDNYRDKARGK